MSRALLRALLFCVAKFFVWKYSKKPRGIKSVSSGVTQKKYKVKLLTYGMMKIRMTVMMAEIALGHRPRL